MDSKALNAVYTFRIGANFSDTDQPYQLNIDDHRHYRAPQWLLEQAELPGVDLSR